MLHWQSLAAVSELSGPLAISSRPYRTVTGIGDLLSPLPNCEGRCRSPAAEGPDEILFTFHRKFALPFAEKKRFGFGQKSHVTDRGKFALTSTQNLSVKYTYRSRKTTMIDISREFASLFERKNALTSSENSNHCPQKICADTTQNSSHRW